MKTRIAYLSLIAAVLLIGTLGVQTAEAGIRVRATVSTPHFGIQVNSGPVYHPQVVRRAQLPVRRHVSYRVSKHDKQVAGRLSRFTGVSKRELINLRAQGYRWKEIGRWLDLSRHTVKAAQDSRSWKRFLKQDRRYASRYQSRSGRGGDRHICYDD